MGLLVYPYVVNATGYLFKESEIMNKYILALILLTATPVQANTEIEATVKFSQGIHAWFDPETNKIMGIELDHIEVLGVPSNDLQGSYADHERIVDVVCEETCIVTVQ